MKTEEMTYDAQGLSCKGYLAYETVASNKKRAAVIIAHTWRGRDTFVCDKAEELAKLGYVAFAADLFGGGLVAESDSEAASLIKPLFLDRKLLRERILGAYETVKSLPMVDPSKIAAIGFCFGGLAVIELLRSGANIKGVVSFHGVLGDTLGGMKAKLAPANLPLKGALLLLHGYLDPMVSQADLTAIQAEFSKAKVDWQLHVYGNAAHAFTNRDAKDTQNGLIYDASAEKRSWASMKEFLNEKLTI